MKKRLILDANILINYVSNLEETKLEIKNIFNWIRKDKIIIFLPDLAFYELIYNLKKQNQAKNLLEFLGFLIESPNVFTYKMDNKEFLDITKISLEYNLTTYDSSYLFLSLATWYQVITMDKRFYNAVSEYYENVVLI